MSNARHHHDTLTERNETQRQTTDQKLGSAPFTAGDIKALRAFVDDADKLLPRLDLDGKPGLCRAEIIAAESNKHVSQYNRQVLIGLNNIEPSVQEAWQVPGHRAHLRDSAHAADLRWEADGRQKLDADWSQRLRVEAHKYEAKSAPALKQDAILQSETYWHQSAVSAERLNTLKTDLTSASKTGVINDVGSANMARRILAGLRGEGLEITSDKRLQSEMSGKDAGQYALDLKQLQNTRPPLLLDQ